MTQNLAITITVDGVSHSFESLDELKAGLKLDVLDEDVVETLTEAARTGARVQAELDNFRLEYDNLRALFILGVESTTAATDGDAADEREEAPATVLSVEQIMALLASLPPGAKVAMPGGFVANVSLEQMVRANQDGTVAIEEVAMLSAA